MQQGNVIAEGDEKDSEAWPRSRLRYKCGAPDPQVGLRNSTVTVCTRIFARPLAIMLDNQCTQRVTGGTVP